jgi:hypothetical protein
MIDNAIEAGSTQRCPVCQLAGVKDDGCTHMTCPRCESSWCYLCGMSEETCLVDEDEAPSFAAHNNNWNNHEGRCPMSLTSIHEVDDRWPQDDQDCLEYFHRYRTLCELYDILKIIGQDKLVEINEAFRIIDNTGYTIDEISDYHDRILIRYQNENED